jgi:hypothetical protein
MISKSANAIDQAVVTSCCAIEYPVADVESVTPVNDATLNAWLDADAAGRDRVRVRDAVAADHGHERLARHGNRVGREIPITTRFAIHATRDGRKTPSK